jgi:hypothetical protein
MITDQEDRLLLELAKARKEKNKAGRLVIGFADVGDDEQKKDAGQLMTYFEMTNYVKEAGFMGELSGKPDFIVEEMEPNHSSRVPLMCTIPFYILSLGFIPLYTNIDWGYDFAMRAASEKSGRFYSVSCHTYGFSGWMCLIMNWVPGWAPHSISGEYNPIEVECRLILQLQALKKDMLSPVTTEKAADKE